MSKSPLNIGILGCGQIGKALADFYHEPMLADIGFTTFKHKLDVLNICIPWSDQFETTVIGYCRQYQPSLVINHATVPVGTTGMIYHNAYPFIVHSPIRGRHPDLTAGLKCFIKFIGADDDIIGSRAEKHLVTLGMNVLRCTDSKTTELLKLLDTTYYGLCIAFHDYAKQLCDSNEISFSEAMTAANITYNQGYSALDQFKFIRPVLDPPSGPIGGHCIIPNAEILLKQFGPNSMLQSILNCELEDKEKS